MYGVPADLPLDRFVGVALNQVALGRFQIQFHFGEAGYFLVEGNWELRNVHGDLIDRHRDDAERETYRIHKIIGQEVVSYDIVVPLSFTLHFKNDFALTIYDASTEFESFSMYPDHIYV